MNKPLRLSLSIVAKVPEGRRIHSLSNLKWIGRNIRLSNSERTELLHAIREEEKSALK